MTGNPGLAFKMVKINAKDLAVRHRPQSGTDGWLFVYGAVGNRTEPRIVGITLVVVNPKYNLEVNGFERARDRFQTAISMLPFCPASEVQNPMPGGAHGADFQAAR